MFKNLKNLRNLCWEEHKGRGKEKCSICEVGGHVIYKWKITRQSHVLMCRLSKKKSQKRTQMNKNNLALSFRSLHLILELGIARRVFRHWERPIYVCTAALSAGVPVVVNLTLPSNLQTRLQSHQKLS